MKPNVYCAVLESDCDPNYFWDFEDAVYYILAGTDYTKDDLILDIDNRTHYIENWGWVERLVVN